MLMSTTRQAHAFWASTLINRDGSGLDEQEVRRAFAWEREQGLGEPVSASNLDARGTFDGLRTEVYDYEFLVSIPLDEIIVPSYQEAVKLTDGGSGNHKIEDAEFADEAKAVARADCEQFIHLG